MTFLPFLHAVSAGRDLSTGEARGAMEMILAGTVSSSQMGGFLVALHMKGETVDELTGFARAMREVAVAIHPGLNGEPLIDTCGTGGDGLATFNISTVAAFVVAGAGVHVAKHGNRAMSSRCGSADVLEALGVSVTLAPEAVGRAIREVGIGFLFAPAHHSAIKHVQPVRLDLKMRTFFNLLGPLTNPAGATAQLVGAPSEKAAELMAHTLAALGLARGFVVHAADGMDEISTTGSTLAFRIEHGRVERLTLEPEDFGVGRAEAAHLKGGDTNCNAAIAREVLAGAFGPPRDIVIVNASAALVAAGKASDFREGVRLAKESIDSGAARARLEALARFA
jgi:anthranilate phosphoribosyltransferase